MTCLIFVLVLMAIGFVMTYAAMSIYEFSVNYRVGVYMRAIKKHKKGRK